MENILLVTVDSLRADHLGCYGYGRPTSPNIDALAESAHRFDNAFANAQATRPSFPAILTSTYPLMYGGTDRLADDQTVLAKPLSDAGYRTGGFHSNVFLSAEFGYDQGFDVFYESQSDPSVGTRMRNWVKDTLDQDGIVFKMLKRAFDTTEKHAGIEIGSSYVSADTITDRAIEFVRNGLPTGNFLWVHYMDVHHPYLPPDTYQKRFRDDVVSDRESIRLRRKMLEEPGDVTEDELREIVDIYDAEIRFMDEEVGRLLDAVDEAWTEVGTFFTSDHGEEFNEHDSFSHSTFHEEGIHVPLLVDVRDGTTGVHDELVALLDLAPTILDYAGAPIPDTYRGESFRPVIEDEAQGRDYVIGEGGYQEDGEPRVFYRDERWKYIADCGEENLYDLSVDPAETEDLSKEETAALEEILTVLKDHRNAVEATDEEIDQVDIPQEMEDRLQALGYKD